MNIQQLESFLWVARLSSVTRACERLNVTQSTISMRLKTLESDLGVPLFDRAHKRLKLTMKGRNLLRYAEGIVDMAHEAKIEIGDSNSLSGTLCLGIAELIALTWGPKFIRKISRRYPNLVLDLNIGAPVPLSQGLENGTLDLVLAPMLAESDSTITSVPLGTVPFVWVGSSRLGFGNKVLTPRDLEAFPIIGVASNQSAIYLAIHKWYAESSVTVPQHIACNSLAAAASLARESVGISLLPEIYCRSFIDAGELQILRTAQSFGLNFFARYSDTGTQSLIRHLANMAKAASTFGTPEPSRNAGEAV
jgi:DNA-binding transcriptional LysR family regulator